MIKYPHTEDRKFAELEFYRMGFDKESRWRISDINKDFELCNTYPRFLIVPSSFKDEDLESVAKFRYFRRIPTAAWRHNKNGCFIVRSSQPTVGWFGWFRSDLDEALVQSYVSNTIQQKPPSTDNDISASEQTNDNNNHDEVKKSSEADVSSQRDGDEVLTNRILNINLAHDDKDSNGHSIVASNGSRNMLTDGSNDTVQSNDRAKHHQNRTPDQIDNVHETIKENNTLTLYRIAAAPSNTTTRSADSISQTNGDIYSLADDSTNDAKVTEQLKNSQLQLDPTLPSTNIVNGNGQTPVDNHSTSDNSAHPLSTDSSDNPTPTSASNDTTTNNSTTATTSATQQATTSKMLIIDARSYAAAMANRAKGGGCECSEYYQRCEVHFMNLANIHSIRKSYHAIRSVCEAYSEQSNNWVSFLDNSRWLHHISGLLRSALLIVDAIDVEEKSVLIHCSDGWDRTPQLVALAETMLDPYYRTFDGFRTMIQREWLDFGHKFADRCGSNPCNEDPNERCPVFLQWLDCIQQLLVQYPKHFEFNSRYLDKLNRHTYSNVFCTFSYNSSQERILSRVEERMGSLWSYFDSARDKFRNKEYVKSDDILRPSFKVKDLHFWKEVYLPPVNHPKNPQTPFIPITSTTATTTTSNNTTTTTTTNLDNNKCSHDSLYIDGLTRTVCK
uniref:Myotubularin-related protein 3 n=1 Tax=Aceria tosichella TaxID=561515 RepID=A0A6G1SK07_9ACAR